MDNVRILPNASLLTSPRRNSIFTFVIQKNSFIARIRTSKKSISNRCTRGEKTENHHSRTHVDVLDLSWDCRKSAFYQIATRIIKFARKFYKKKTTYVKRVYGITTSVYFWHKEKRSILYLNQLLQFAKFQCRHFKQLCFDFYIVPVLKQWQKLLNNFWWV